MRTLLLAVLLASPLAARAETLVVDESLLVDTTRILEDEGRMPVGASTALPFALEASRQTAAGTPAGHTFGIGIQVGAPTAVTIKYMLAANQGVVVGVGAGFGWPFTAGLSIHADYLFDVAQLVNNGTIALTAYLGPGLWLAVFNHGYGFGLGYYYQPGFTLFGLGARLPLGLSMSFAALPLEVYLELDPALFFFPGIDFGIGASLGFRFYF